MFYTKFGDELGWRNIYAVFKDRDCYIIFHPPSNNEFVHFSLLSDEERDLVWETWKEFCHNVSQSAK